MSLSTPDQATRNRSASTGPPSDLPEHEHKRPRLSQNNINDHNSTTKSTNLRTSDSNSPPPAACHVETKLIIPPRSPSPNIELITGISPTSKVTINTRPLSAQALNNPTIMTLPATIQQPNPSINPAQSSVSTSSSLVSKPERSNDSEPISISSSESSSPQPIQVAAPEDFGQDPADTEWEPVDGVASPGLGKIGPRWVQNTFPFADSLDVGSAHRTLRNIGDVFESGSAGDGQIFLQVKDWLVLLVSRADSLEQAVLDADFSFWSQLPTLATSLVRRDAQPLSGVDISHLVDFFAAWARLTVLIIKADIEQFRTLASHGDGRGAKVAFAFDYTQAVYWSLLPSNTPLTNTLSKTHENGASLFVGGIIAQLRRRGGSALIRALSELFDVLAAFISKRQQVSQQVFNILQHSHFLIHALLPDNALFSESASEAASIQTEITAEARNFLSKANAALDSATVKQHAWLTIDNCDQILKHFEQFVKTLVQNSPSLAIEVVTAANVDPQDFEINDLPALAVLAWRFTALRKLMTKGRMELRVFAIGAMADDLVKVFNDHIRGMSEPSLHPVVRLMSTIIRNNELVRYIVGVDSHPQIINRSTNVVGFLCVSHTFRNEDTDAIWQTTLQSQDPRAGAEVLSVLKNNLDNLDYHALRHIVCKITELSCERLNQGILDFTFTVLRGTSVRLNVISESIAEAQALNSLTLRLCLKLLRENHTPSTISNDVAERIRNSAPEAIQARFKPYDSTGELGVTAADLHAMVKELCISVAAHDVFACGSILALTNILSCVDSRVVDDLVHQNDLTRLIVEHIVDFVHSGQLASIESGFRLGFECHLSALPLLMLRVPDTFSDVLLDAIWEGLLSSRASSEETLATGWLFLGQVYERSNAHNSVADRIIADHMPLLKAIDYSKASLDCIQQMVEYEVRLNPPKPAEEGGIIIIPGMEQLWQIMLSALANTVEVQAAEFIILEHLDSSCVIQTPLASVEATHLCLIDRCVRQITDAASAMNESETQMKMTPTADESVRASQDPSQTLLCFRRSLFFLRRFLDALKSRPRYSTGTKIDIRDILAQFERQGDSLELTVQIHGHKIFDSKPQKWLVGQENSPSQLWQYISDITGWPQFNVIYGGGRVDWQMNTKSLSESKIVPGMVMINKVAGSSEVAPSRAVRSASPVDNKIMDHFDELYHLLDLPDQLAKEVYEFLAAFPLHDEALARLRLMSAPAEDLLPVARPYKLMYYLRAMRSCVEDESFSNQPNVQFLKYAVKVMASTLAQCSHLNAELVVQSLINNGLMEVLLLAFKAKVSQETSISYLEDSPTFLLDIVNLWTINMNANLPTIGHSTTVSVIRVPFEVLLEACLHDPTSWQRLPQEQVSVLLRHALLTHPAEETRQAVLEVINNAAGTSAVKSILKLADPRMPRMRFPQSSITHCLHFLWQELSGYVEFACEKPSLCQQYFESMVSLLKVYGKSLELSPLRDHVKKWLHLLLNHHHEQEVGHTVQDSVVKYLAKLLIESFKLKAEIVHELSEKSDVVHDIFSLFLFPPLSAGKLQGYQIAPVLDMQVRQVLYDLVLALSRSTGGMEITVSELDNDLIPKDYFFQPTINNDRQALRSEVGYAGLRNLSNTCYLNSLFSQLFMNVEFRDLMLNINIVDQSKQKLIVELGKVFAYMQNSYEDAVSPASAVDAITLWDGEQIDVAVQMDVDEFFNLLFDRIEFQIPDLQVRSQFKSIYGGQLVQQIKSKECEHISERLEPFSAVQVEIKGQMSLEDSLKAYVEGEVLQGENKYSCTGCGKHVDAIKRACLKDVPDHLIFNLKRFDYDIMTGMRCKVNDEFQFPHALDMAPYKLAALADSQAPIAPDMFELVGVIVHSGTAESGHYYSYIRQRPSEGNDKLWAQFNDHDVTRFDPASIRDCCFGGIDFGAVQCPKFYNGYMLFYQRTSAIERAKTTYTTGDAHGPVRVALPDDLEKHIAQHNELYLRSYIAQSPEHARFVRQLLQSLPVFGKKACSEDHNLEDRIICVVLDYVNQISARWKDQPEVEETLKGLELLAEQCVICAEAIIKWFLRDLNLADNLIRTCYPVLRKQILHLLCTCWQSLADEAIRLDIEDSADHSSVDRLTYKTALESFFDILARNFDLLQRHGRAWEQYFGMLSYILKFGNEEPEMIIDKGFFERALELVHVHIPSNISKRMRVRYGAYLLGRDRNRPHAPGAVIQFVAEMLPHIDFSNPAPDSYTRLTPEGQLGLNEMEEAMMGLDTRPIKLLWLKKIIVGNYNTPAADTIIALLSRVKKLNSPLGALLRDGLSDSTISTAVYYLRPTLIFLSQAVSDQAIIEVVDNALELIESTGGQYGAEFLGFVKSLESMENTAFPFKRGALSRHVYGNMGKWAPVLLISPNDPQSDVRGDTLEYINTLLFSAMEHAQQTDPSQYDNLQDIARELAEACATYVSSHFLSPKSKEPMNLQAGQANQILTVTDNCLLVFGDTADDESRESRITAIMEDLRQRGLMIAEAMSSIDWKDASSDLEALSEVDLSELSP